MTRFEKVTRFKDNPNLLLPERKTAGAAGYDFMVAEETIVPPCNKLMQDLIIATRFIDHVVPESLTYNLRDIESLTKQLKTRPTLVPTGIKCYLATDEYLKLVIRSSCPLKYWLILANSEGIIDSDYVDNPQNEGEIFFQVINLSPVSIRLQPGDIIGQGIIQKYVTVANDQATAKRTGGFGSTSK